MEFYFPKKRRQPFITIPATKPGEMPVLLFGCDLLDGHQAEEIIAKVQEDRQKPKRLLVPKHVAITRLRDKLTKQISGYVIEQKEA